MRRASTLALVAFLLASASAALPPLRCCAIIEEPMISCKLPEQESEPKYEGEPLNSTSSENCSFNGLGILYYHLLTKAMPEFKCIDTHLWETVRAENKGLNLDIYNGFTGFTQYLKNCDDGVLKECTCNIGIGGFSRNSERDRKIDAVAPFVFDSLSFIQSVKNFDSKRGFWFFFSPFDGKVWLGIFSLIVSVIAIMLLDQDYDPPKDAATASQGDHTSTAARVSTFSARVKTFLVHNPVLRRIRFAVLSVTFAFAGHIFDAPSKKERKLPTGRQRLLLLVALLFGTFLVLAYEASLVLNLFIGDSSSKYRGVEDIFNCKVNDSDICFPGDGNTQSFWDEVATPLRDISGCTSKARVIRGPCEEGEEQEKRFDKVKSGLDLVKKYGDGKTKSNCTCRYFLGSTSATAYWLDTEDFCSEVTSIGEPFYTNLLGFVLPPNSTWTADLSKKTLQESSSLSIPSPMEYRGSKNGTNACTFNDESRLTFSALRGFFIVAWSFLSVVFLFMCISIVTRLMSEKCGPSAEAVVP